MPRALERVNQASALLLDAARILKYESSSVQGRQMLIQGARCKTIRLNIFLTKTISSRYSTGNLCTSSHFR